MDSSTTHHHQEMSMGSDDQSLESILGGQTKSQQEAAMKKPRPQDEQALNCPRCDSTNTKFCYYNNYSLSQPRYFCKSCRRYWTKGGTLRNVPVGGGCRKTKRPSSSKRVTITTGHHHEHQDHQLQDLIALSSNGTALQHLAYDQASNQIENFHLPLTFAHQLHNKLSNGQLDGQDFPMPHGFLDAPGANDMQGLYYGLGGAAIREANTDGGVSRESMMLHYEETKPDLCSGESRILWGCPWPINGDGISNSGDLGSIRGSWNNAGFSSSWHTLLHSPLM